MVRVEKVSNLAQLSKIRDFGILTPEFAAGETTIFWPLETLHSWFHNRGGPMLVALGGADEIAGYILGLFHGVGVATIENLQVLPDWRGRGVGHRLIERFDFHAMNSGISTVRTLFHTRNNSIASLFGKHGYEARSETIWLSRSEPVSTDRIVQSSGIAIDSRRLLATDVSAANDLIGLNARYPWGLDELSDVGKWVMHPDCCCVGAFVGNDLVGAAFASVNDSAQKATIEVLAAVKGDLRRSVFLVMIEWLLADISNRSIGYVSAHPDSCDRDILECLVQSGLSRKQAFVPYVKGLEEKASS